MRRLRNSLSYVAAVSAAFACSGSAQWTSISLHPPGATRSYALNGDGDQFVGFMWPPIDGRALYWDGIGPSIDLTPAGALGAQAWGVEDGMQVGVAEIQGEWAAAVWFGTAESFISINPTTATRSTANKVRNGVIVGGATIAGVSGAGLWTNPSHEAYVDLAPPGFTNSVVSDTDGQYQVGFTVANSDFNAAVWQGTKESYLNIHPAGRHESRAVCIADNMVGGYTTFNTARDATLWFLPGYTTRNIHPYNTEPFGYSSSEVWAMADGIQVGYYADHGDPEASMWEGTSGSWFSLERFLPAGSNYSRARGISVDAENMYVLVESQLPVTGPQAYVLVAKRTTTVLPSSAVAGPGAIISGGLNEIKFSDDSILRGRPGPVFSTTMAPFQLTVEAECPLANPESIEFVLESHASAAGMNIEIAFYNWQSNSYEVAGTGASFGGDRTMNGYKGGYVGRYVHPTTRKMRAKVSYKAVAPVFAFPWVVSVDRAVFKVPRVK